MGRGTHHRDAICDQTMVGGVKWREGGELGACAWGADAQREPHFAKPSTSTAGTDICPPDTLAIVEKVVITPSTPPKTSDLMLSEPAPPCVSGAAATPFCSCASRDAVVSPARKASSGVGGADISVNFAANT